MKQFHDFKYMRFVLILAVTGLFFCFREQLVSFLPENREAVPDGAVNIPADEVGEENRANEAGDTLPGETESCEVPWAELQPGESGETADNEDEGGFVYETVDETYFDDALFIGDSRTVGLQDYAGLDNTTFYATTGLTVYKLFDSQIVPVEGSKQKITIEEALCEKQFAKIYLMVGINEMGTGTVDTFMDKYREVVAHLQELQPEAVIYVQAIMRVSTERSDKGDYINNEGIDARNAEIAKLEDGKRIFYLDVNPYVCDENGGLVQDYTFDGVHLRAKYISVWKQFLMEHAVAFL